MNYEIILGLGRESVHAACEIREWVMMSQEEDMDEHGKGSMVDWGVPLKW